MSKPAGEISINQSSDPSVEQIGQAIAIISELTYVDAFIIENCAFKIHELAAVFKKASDCHNEITSLHETLQEIETGYKAYVPYKGGGDMALKSASADSLKIIARIDYHENRLQRLADSLLVRAQLKRPGGPHV